MFPRLRFGLSGGEGGEGCWGIEPLAVPEFEEQKSPEAGGVVKRAGEMFLDERFDCRRAEITAAESAGVEEHFA